MASLDTVVIKITGDSKDIDKTISKLEKVGKVDRQNAKSFKKTSKEQGKAMSSLKGQAVALGGALLGAFAIQAVVGSAVKTLREFEKEMSTLQSITGSTTEEMKAFETAAKDVGKATKTSATEVVKAFTLIGSAQPELLKSSKALAEVTKQSLILSKAAGISATDAANALTGAMNQFGVSAKDAAKFTDIFATSQQKGSSFIQATSEALKNSGAAANAAGLSFETTNAAIQALAKGALVGSEAGTALRGVLIKLSSQSDDTINPSMVGLGSTIDELASRNLSLAEASKLVGAEGATGLLTLIKQNKLFKELDGNLNEAGNAMAQMAINTDNLDGALDEANNAWEDLILNMSDSDGILTTVVEQFTAILRGLTDGAFAITVFDNAMKGLTDDSVDNVAVLKDQIKGRAALLVQLIAEGKLATAEIVAKDIQQKKVQLLIEQRKVEADLSAEAILAAKEKAMIDAAALATEKAAEQARLKKIGSIGLLKKRISELKNELLNQADAGEVNKDTLQELNDSVARLEEAEMRLKVALTGTLEPMKAQSLELDKTKEGLESVDELIKGFSDIQKEEAEALKDERLKAIAEVSEAEQFASGIIAQINTNKLIALDNEETKALRALELQGLGEEELAQKKLDIQTKADAKRAAILTKQAKADKAAAIFQAVINTAVGITQAIPNPLLIALASSIGAIELASIAAQPIPTFHTGKKSELKDGELFAKILKSETVVPPEASKKHKRALDAMIDKRYESYVYQEYMLPMMRGMTKKDSSPYDDINIWNMQNKQLKTMRQGNALTQSLIKSLDTGNHRRSWR